MTSGFASYYGTEHEYSFSLKLAAISKAERETLDIHYSFARYSNCDFAIRVQQQG